MTNAPSAMTPGLIVNDRSLWRPKLSWDAGWVLRIFRAACVLFVLFASNMRMPSFDFAWSLYDRGAAAWQNGSGVGTRPRPAVHERAAALPTTDPAESRTGDAGAASRAPGSEAR